MGRLLYFRSGLMLLVLMAMLPELAHAATAGMPAVSVTEGPGGTKNYSLTLQVLALMTLLTFLPAALMMMTSFTRIVIVLAILRQALGLAQTPSNQVLVGMALFLTLFIMTPVFDKVNQEALQPYMADEMNFQTAMDKGVEPFKKFMLAQTRDDDLALFARIAGVTDLESPDDVPLTLLMPAFITSELKTAFQIGFLIFLPFVIIDMIVASVLMAMGMMMLSPLVISLPFKLMLFVLVDGWALIMGTLASSFYVQ